MFDLDWSKMAILAAVALIVIGPKDLPRVLRTVGQWTGKARAMAREFQNSIEELARESELESLKKDVEKAVTLDVAAELDPDGELKKSIEDVQSLSSFDPAKELSVEPGEAPAHEVATDAPEVASQPPQKTGTGAAV
jgi:sec-independent protein translocase protein TatB